MRLRIEEQYPRIAKHIDLLSQYPFSHEDIAEMICGMNGVKITRKTVDRYLERKNDGKQMSQLSLPPKDQGLPKRLKWFCRDCGNNKLIVDREAHELVCTTCGFVNADLRLRTVDLGTQIASMTPESGLSDNHGLGTWVSKRDLWRLGLNHVSWQLAGGFSNDPSRLREMIRYASSILKGLHGLPSKSDEFKKARYAQIRWACEEIIRLVYSRVETEIQSSVCMTEDALSIRGKQFVDAIIDIALEDFLGGKHRLLQSFRGQHEVKGELRQKIADLLRSQFPKIPVSQPSEVQEVIPQ